MERQRSFSIKPTRFFLFCCTVASSILFISFCSIWVYDYKRSPFQQTQMQLNTTPVELSTKHVTVNFSDSGVQGLILTAAHDDTAISASGFVSILNGSEGELNRGLKSHADETGSGGGNLSVVGIKDPIFDETLVGQSEIVSGFGEDLGGSKILASGVSDLNLLRNVSEESLVMAVQDLNNVSVLEAADGSSVCDVTKGKWVIDESYPLYTNSSCPFIDEGFDCLGNGRPDKEYVNWRWQPESCEIPRFNASNMLEMIRGKRLVFVGDSINRNQFESMLCLLMGAVKDPKSVYETHKRRITKEKGNYSFRFADYACTVEYYVTHFLVHEGKARVGQKRRQVLKIDSIDRGSSRWRGADILVFNTAHWWSHDKTKAGTNYFQEMGLVHSRLDVSTAFRKALTTWASWVDKNINPQKTQVFFRSSSPSHFRGGLWNSGGHCTEAKHPIKETLPSHTPEKNLIVEEVLKQMKTQVTLLNITNLSEYRVDAHPSIYGKKVISTHTQDCSHWCLPGVPDTWNQLLYFHIYSKQKLKPDM